MHEVNEKSDFPLCDQHTNTHTHMMGDGCEFTNFLLSSLSLFQLDHDDDDVYLCKAQFL